MTVAECLKDLPQNPGFALYYPEKKIWLQGNISDYKWKKINKLKMKKMKEDESTSVEATSSTEGSFWNIFKKL